MRAYIYQEMARLEDTHWWFCGRRSILQRRLASWALPAGAAILDAGAGTGGNLAMLSKFGEVFALEMDDTARAMANARGIAQVEAGHLPDAIPFPGQLFDLAVMLDVLEHVEEDKETLQSLHSRLKPGGKLMLTVPAFPFLWSDHDVVHHHKRRYRLPALIHMVERAGFQVTFASHLNFWLFPVIALIRLANRVTGSRLIEKRKDANPELHLPPALLNSALEHLFASEAYLLDGLRLPFGVSILLQVERI